MRSTEASGVRAKAVDSRSSSDRFFTSISPLTYAIALTAIISATLFVAADAIRTFDDFGQNINPTTTKYVVQDGKFIDWDKSEYATGKRKLKGR